MQESEEKKVAGKHVAPEPTAAPPEEDVLRTDADLYGDETDLPLKTRKSAAKKKKSAAKKRRRKKKKNNREKGVPRNGAFISSAEGLFL